MMSKSRGKSSSIYSNPSMIQLTHSEEESDSSDDGEKDLYKNITAEQLRRARAYNECFICQKQLTTFKTFRNHVLLHRIVEKKHQCLICLKEFAKESYLKAHLTCHDENRIFTCEICSKNFVTKSSIRGHMRIHTGEKRYKCDVCGKAFTESSTRRKHRLTHFPDQKKTNVYQCHICAKSLKEKHSLMRHLDRHEKATEDGVGGSCKLCGKSFTTTRSLTGHVSSHFTNKKFACEWCSCKYTTTRNLKKHIATIHGDNNLFKCEICPKVTFTSQKKLKEHQAKHCAQRVNDAEEDKRNLCLIPTNSELNFSNITLYNLQHSMKRE